MKKQSVFLVSKLSGYLMACLRELKAQTGCEIMVCHWPVADEAPFDEVLFKPIDQRIDKGEASLESLTKTVLDLEPDFIYISGWMDKDYLHVGRTARKRGIPVVGGCDTQWKGGLRQHLACLIAPWYLHRAIDILWVSGERQREFAKRLGYVGKNCMEGMYACDWEAIALNDASAIQQRDKAFLYVGRLMERKGTEVLLEAYQQYRQRSASPWPLYLVGTGPMKEAVQNHEGVNDLGFKQPADLPQVYRRASCFIMPSLYEPWGVAIQEAAANRMPLICSDACGAAVHLLRDGYNGYKVATGNPDELCDAMSSIERLSSDQRGDFSSRSYELSKQYTPKLWVVTLSDWLSARKQL
ncbi:glycosyltransferase family 4 protein [Akkermansiaceae bacterium]|nr:glycosyltransferase family 4 protein [Akkermansiaceae bacterium]